MAARLARLVRELAARRRDIRARRKRIKALPKGKRRTRLVRYQRKVRRRADKVRVAIIGIRRENARWGGSRAVTNEVIDIVGDRAEVTSRKRPWWHRLSRANSGSDHNGANKTADAVDFGIAEAYDLAREIADKLGAPGEWTGDYDSFEVVRDGVRYRVQMIAGDHGTGPHLHVGVRRIG